MKFLFDTNIWIPLEPTSVTELVPDTPILAELVRLITQSGNSLWLHRASFDDLAKDKNAVRQRMRTQLLAKYRRLPDPPAVSVALQRAIGTAAAGTNDAIDDLLLAALERDAVDYLVTADGGIHAKAKRAGLAGRAVMPSEALAIVRNLFEPSLSVVPPVRKAKAHVLDEADPIFDSFRTDYPHFDDWLRKCRQQERDVWMIGREGEPLLAFTILKREEPGEDGLRTAALKICSFKVADHARGFRYGERLLRAAFDESYRANVDRLYVTVFEKYEDLIRLFTLFGFQLLADRTKFGELVFAKSAHPTPDDRALLAPWEFHMRFGPRYVKATGVPLYVVPIQPKYHSKLFPEIEPQAELFQGETAFGNSILKAYLCHAPMRQLMPGHVLLFYRSHSKEARAVGVVEGTLLSRSPEEISRFVGRRTVYNYETIRHFCRKGPVLAILFRQADSLKQWVSGNGLIEHGVIKAPPQSIARVSQRKGIQWLTSQIER